VSGSWSRCAGGGTDEQPFFSCSLRARRHPLGSYLVRKGAGRSVRADG
jgi:hypothetical protein